MTQIRETRVNKAKSCGILRPVHKFDQFVQEAENLFHNEERRVELEKVMVLLDVFCQISHPYPSC